MRYWVVSAGGMSRDYRQEFFDLGMAFLGGEEPLARLAQVRPGDVLILKHRLSHVVAAGRVVDRGAGHSGRDDKEWLRDVDGWDLTGYCYVDWHVPAEKVPATAEMGLTQGTIYETKRPVLIDLANRLLAGPPRLPTREEPTSQTELSDEEILTFLIAEGLRPAAADELTNTIRRIRLLASYYYSRRWKDVKEHEARTFLVVPLLLAMGWAEQQLKIEYATSERRRIDIACFARPYTERGQDCPLIIETKDFQSGLANAKKQAMEYAADFPTCRGVLVTNGYCYKFYQRDSESDAFSTAPSAYLNLLRPRARYPLDPSIPGALEVLRQLLPGSIGQS